MLKLIVALLFGGALAHAPAVPTANPTPPASARTSISDHVDVAGPFETFEEADDYAFYLEFEFGYETEIVEYFGAYFVIYG